MDKRAAEIERFVRQHNIEHYRKAPRRADRPTAAAAASNASGRVRTDAAVIAS
jgi:hypothetical protein